MQQIAIGVAACDTENGDRTTSSVERLQQYAMQKPTLMTGVMRPPSGIDTANETLTCSAYVMPSAPFVHAARHCNLGTFFS